MDLIGSSANRLTRYRTLPRLRHRPVRLDQGEPQAGDGAAPKAVGGHGRGRQRLVAGQDGLQLLGLRDPQVRDAAPARPRAAASSTAKGSR